MDATFVFGWGVSKIERRVLKKEMKKNGVGGKKVCTHFPLLSGAISLSPGPLSPPFKSDVSREENTPALSSFGEQESWGRGGKAPRRHFCCTGKPSLRHLGINLGIHAWLFWVVFGGCSCQWCKADAIQLSGPVGFALGSFPLFVLGIT